MRRLLVPVAALLALVLVGPPIVGAQDATPATSPASGLTETDSRYFLPYGPDGLKDGLTVATNDDGACSNESVEAPGRPDAWDCLGRTSDTVYDPCFENPFATPGQPVELACIASPFATDVVLFAPTAPLPRQKDGGGAAEAVASDPWAYPWVLELTNGERCALLPTPALVVAGQAIHYACPGGSILGEVDRDQAVWTVAYAADGDLASSRVDVAVAWT